MAFEAPKTMITGLVEIHLPSATLRLCDGGFIYKDGQKFASSDPDFGSIESVDSLVEGAGDEAPAGNITFLPASTAATAALSQPSFQNSPILVWQAEVDEATGLVVGTPQLLLNALLDTTELRLSRGKRTLEMGYITASERLFSINEGNVLSPRFHKSIWPGETGLDNATGVGLSVAWGVESPPRQYNYSGSGGGGAGASSGTAGSFGGGSVSGGMNASGRGGLSYVLPN
ncbi:MAG: hypothetical protein ACXW27_09135 [Allosphingosinicella sp.]